MVETSQLSGQPSSTVSMRWNSWYGHHDPCHAHAAPAGDDDDHGAGRPVGAAQHAADGMRNGKQEIARRQQHEHRMPVSDDLRIVGEDPQRAVTEQKQQTADEERSDQRQDEACLQALSHPFMFAGTDILSGERSDGHRIAHRRQDRKAIDLRISAAASHGSRTKCIDVALYDEVGKRDDGILDPAGQSYAHDLAEDVCMQLQAGKKRSPFCFIISAQISAALMHWEMSVAQATPAMPM